jgi:hypothetical protein
MGQENYAAALLVKGCIAKDRRTSSALIVGQ